MFDIGLTDYGVDNFNPFATRLIKQYILSALQQVI